MREKKFRALSVELAADLEARLDGLSDEDRDQLSMALGAFTRVMHFVRQPKSDALAAAGKSVTRFFEAATALSLPMVGVGQERAGEIIASQLPEMEKVAPTIGAILSAVLSPPQARIIADVTPPKMLGGA